MDRTMGFSSKDLLNHFLKNNINRRCAANIFQLLTRQYTAGKLNKIKRKIQRNPAEIINGVEFLKNKVLEDKEFSASVVPTIVSSDRARNFLLRNEKEPTEDDIYYWLYVLLSGLYSGTYVINLINVGEDAKENFRRRLIDNQVMFIDRRGIDRKVLSQVCRGAMPPGEHTFAFAFLNYLMYWYKNQMKNKLGEKNWQKRLDEWGLPKSLITDWKITDETTLIVFNLPREKREMHYIPKIRDFIYKWYSDFFSNLKLEYPPIGMFMFSMYDVDRNRKQSAALLNKFLYYFLQGYVNGDILEKLVLLRTDYVFSTEKKVGIIHAKNFFSKLS